MAARAAALHRRHILLGLIAFAAVIALAVPWGTKADPALAAPAPARAGIGTTLAAHSAYVVRPGDTASSIARRLDPRGGGQSLATAIRAQAGGGRIRVGERLLLP